MFHIPYSYVSSASAELHFCKTGFSVGTSLADDELSSSLILRLQLGFSNFLWVIDDPSTKSVRALNKFRLIFV